MITGEGGGPRPTGDGPSVRASSARNHMIPCRLRLPGALVLALIVLAGPCATAATPARGAPSGPRSLADGVILPAAGDHALVVLTPTWLELREINTPAVASSVPGASCQASNWNLVDANGNFSSPPTSDFSVTANERPVSVLSVGFRRRPLSASMVQFDVRIDNHRLYSPVVMVSIEWTRAKTAPRAKLLELRLD